MNFILTKFLCPLQKKIVLSENLKAYFDNPRTKEEIEYITEYIKISENPENHTVQHAFFISPKREDAGEVSEEYWVANFEDFLNEFKKSSNNVYIQNFFKKEEEQIEVDPISVVAKMFVIVRYDDEGEIEKLKKASLEMKEKKERGLFILEDSHPIIKNSKNTISLTYLLSILASESDREFVIKSFVLHKNEYDIHDFKFDKNLNISLFYSLLYYQFPSKEDPDVFFIDFQIAIEKLNRWIKVVDEHINKYGDDELNKILFISNRLKEIEDMEEKSQLLSLVSLLELLLTHNPNFNRFNVEDSINKQFIYKVSYLSYLFDNQIDLHQLKKELKRIYNLRSSIAHGNFIEVNKYVASLKEDEYFEDNNIFVSSIVKKVLQKYFEDKVFIDFMKEN